MTEQRYSEIILEGKVSLLVEAAETIGGDLARQLTTHQIRNMFGEVRQIEMTWPDFPYDKADEELTDEEQNQKRQAEQAFRRTVLLRPKLAYQARAGRGVQALKSVLDPCLLIIQNTDNYRARRLYFRRFVDFFEAILAYHKAAGGN